MRDVYVHGPPGLHFKIAVANPREAARAIMTLRPGMRRTFADNDWHIIVGPLATGYHAGADELGMNAGRKEIHFVPAMRVAGGGRGMAIGKIVIGVVLIAATIATGGAAGFGIAALAATGMTATQVVMFGASMILAGIAMMLSPTPKAPKGGDQAHPEERPSFFFNGPVNTSEQGSAVPLIFGYFRAGSIVVDAGIWNEDLAPEEVEAASTRAANTNTPHPPTLFPTPVDLVVAKGGGKGASPGASYAPREAPNTLRSRSVVRVHEILCEGLIQGPRGPAGDWAKSVFFDATPVMAADGSYNFQVIAAHLRLGLPTETPIPGFPAAQAVISTGLPAQVKKGAPIVRRVVGPDTDTVRVNIRTPRMMKQENNGDVNPTLVDVRIEYRVGTTGAWTLVTDNRIEGKTTTGYERSISFFLPPRDGSDIDVRVSRLTDDATELQLANETWWQSTVELVQGQFRYDDTARSAFVVDAEQFPSIPKRAFEFDWLVLQVPTNYDPIARTYTGDWDGNFKSAWSNNPAWVLWYLFTDPTAGLGNQVGAESVDKWSFYEAAVYNDGLVSDGAGGYEPRFTFNGGLFAQEEAATVLQAVASSMRAQWYVAGGVVLLAQDRPAVGLARVFTAANVVNGAFDYQSSRQKSRATVCNVAWVDPEDSWQPNVEPVPYPEMMGRFGYREIGVTAYGCTSRGQAIRLGRYFNWSNHNEQELVGFTVTLENADVRPGELIGIQDASRAAVQWGGRIVSVVGATLTLDRPVPGAPSGTMHLVSGQKVAAIDIASWSSETVVTLASVPDQIVAGGVWAISNPATEITQWRVLGVQEQEGFRFQISAAFHDPRKYAFVEQNLTLPARSYDALPSGALAPPRDVQAIDYYTLDSRGAPYAGLLISWSSSIDPRVIHYVVDAVGPEKTGQHWTTVPGNSVTLAQAPTGEWQINVTGVDAIGRKSAVASVTLNTATVARVPLPPLEFTARQVGQGTALLNWIRPDDNSIATYWLKWTPDVAAPKWESAITVQQAVPRDLESLYVGAQTGVFLIKSVSIRGVESATATVARIDMVDTFVTGAYRAEQTTWPGTKTGFVVVAGELSLPAVSGAMVATLTGRTRARRRLERPGRRDATPLTVGEYITAPLNLTQRAAVLARILLFARGVVSGDIMANWIPLASAVPLARVSSGAWAATVDERYKNADGTWSDWQPGAQRIEVSDSFQFRLQAVVYEPGVEIRVGRMEETLQLAASTLTGSATTDTSGLYSGTFTPPFYGPPVMTFQQTPPITEGGNFVLVAISGTGFTVRTDRANGSAALPSVAFTWSADGYGRGS